VTNLAPQVHELDDMMESTMARDGVRRPANGSALQSWDGWLDADADGAATEIAALLRAARVNATVDPNTVDEDSASQGAFYINGLGMIRTNQSWKRAVV